MLDKFDPKVQIYTKELQECIEKKRDALERPTKTEAETAFLRGYLKALRKVVADLTGDHEDAEDSEG